MPTSTQRQLERLGRAPLALAVAITSPPRLGRPTDRPARSSLLTLVGSRLDHPADRPGSSGVARLGPLARLAGRRLDGGPARRVPAIHGDGGHDDRGQATAEYGLIILAAGGIALGVIAWASGTGSFTDLFDSVVGKLSDSL